MWSLLCKIWDLQLEGACNSVMGPPVYKVVQIWPGLFVCKQVTVCPGHIWTTLYISEMTPMSHSSSSEYCLLSEEWTPVQNRLKRISVFYKFIDHLTHWVQYTPLTSWLELNCLLRRVCLIRSSSPHPTPFPSECFQRIFWVVQHTCTAVLQFCWLAVTL
jgi:hypothetical protein